MHWRKLGRVFVPSGEQWWARKNASFPVIDVIDGKFTRIYFTGLDDDQVGRAGYLDLDLHDPLRVLRVSDEPVLDIGGVGDFDDAGANPFSVVDFRGKKLMYYQGWQRLVRTPFAIFSGVAVANSGDDTTFRKFSRVPLFDRTETERYIRGAPFALVDGNELKLWYVASDTWQERNGTLYYRIGIRCATSLDGFSWTLQPCTGLDSTHDDEYGIGKPTIWKDGNIYRMWYSLRTFSKPYAIGYAESRDGFSWVRKDSEAGIERSADGWDSEMICYPYVREIAGRVLMFYNGNQHGRSGFGCAELVR